MIPFEIVTLTHENLKDYDLFCYKSKYKTQQYQDKVTWVRNQLDLGLKLKILYVDEGRKKLTSRGFIEYIPGEYNWRGVNAPGYLVIHCLFVVGKHKNKGYGQLLIQEALADAIHYNGLVAVASTRNWLVSPKIFEKLQFTNVATAPPSFHLYVKKYKDQAPDPRFSFQKSVVQDGAGFQVFRSPQCPYTYNMEQFVRKYAKSVDQPFLSHSITSAQEAQHGQHPYGTFYITFNGVPFAYESNTTPFIKDLELVTTAK